MHIRFKFFHASAKAPSDYWNYFHRVTFSLFSQFKAKLFVFLDFLVSFDLSICFIWACHIYQKYRFLFFILQCKIRPSRSTARSHSVLSVPTQSLSSIFHHFSFLLFFRILLCSFWHYPHLHCPLNHQNFECIVVVFDIF